VNFLVWTLFESTQTHALFAGRSGPRRFWLLLVLCLTVPTRYNDFLQSSVSGPGSDLLADCVSRGGGCEQTREPLGDHTRTDQHERGELHAQRREKFHRSVWRHERGQLDDPAGPVRPDRDHHDRSPVLPDPGCAAEASGPEEEVRPAVKLRRLAGDGGGGERRGRHAVRSSQPPQMSPVGRSHLLMMTSSVHCQLILIIDQRPKTDQRGSGPNKRQSCPTTDARQIINIFIIKCYWTNRQSVKTPRGQTSPSYYSYYSYS
ncbi:hypothetical protein E3U43_004213, partial [Larimichthys crocea]